MGKRTVKASACGPRDAVQHQPMTSPVRHARARVALAALAVAVVLADSSIVILALPDILGEFDTRVADVAWVLTAFNAVLALAAVPAAYLARTRASVLFPAGLVVFAGASAACAWADSLGPLVAARCAQALGGAAVVGAALGVLAAAQGSERAAARVWAAAGVAGMAVGPALGGALTELLDWRAIFVAQVPVVLAAAAGAGMRVPRLRSPAGRPALLVDAALVALSAALTAALFLLVLLLINGWRLTPVAAAATVTVMPAAAIAAGRLVRGYGGPLARAAAGAVAIAGGLAALGVMPGASVGWTLVPQALVGAGLGLSVEALTERAMLDRSHPAVHAGWTVAARHLGVVLGVLILTPVFVADLDRQQVHASSAVTSLVLDAAIDPATKVTLAQAGVKIINTSHERVPDLGPLFRSVHVADDQRPRVRALQAGLEDQLRRAATSAAERSFLIAAVFALAALVPIGLVARGRP